MIPRARNHGECVVSSSPTVSAYNSAITIFTRFGILGGGSFPPLGTFSEYIVVERDQVIQTPKHLDDVHIAAWPVGGVTAWRSAFPLFGITTPSLISLVHPR